MKTRKNNSLGSPRSSHRKPVNRPKQKRSSSEKISKYFAKNEGAAANITPPYSNVRSIKTITASDDDDFKSPIVAKKLAPVFTNMQAARKKPAKSQSGTFKQKTVNEEHLQLALALSITAEKGSSEDAENVPVYPSTQEVRNNAKRTLEQYGFHSNKEYTARSLLSDEIKRSKKSRFKYITPTLLLRTDEDREKKIGNKVSTVLNEFTHVKEDEPSNETLQLHSENLQKFRSKNRLYNAQSAILPNDEDVTNYYVASLSLSPCTAKCGSLLKQWECIPGRDKSPVREKVRSHSPDLFESDDELFASSQNACVTPIVVHNLSNQSETLRVNEQSGKSQVHEKLSCCTARTAQLEIIDLSQSSDSNADEQLSSKQATASPVQFIIEKYLNSSEDEGDFNSFPSPISRTNGKTSSTNCDTRLGNTSIDFPKYINDTSLILNITTAPSHSNKGREQKIEAHHTNMDVNEDLNNYSAKSLSEVLTTSNFNNFSRNIEISEITANFDYQEDSIEFDINLSNSIPTNTSFNNSDHLPENTVINDRFEMQENNLNHEEKQNNSCSTEIDVVRKRDSISFDNFSDKENCAVNDTFDVRETCFTTNFNNSIPSNAPSLHKTTECEVNLIHDSFNGISLSSSSFFRVNFSDEENLEVQEMSVSRVNDFDVQETNPSCEENSSNSIRASEIGCNEVLEISSDSNASDVEVANLSQNLKSFKKHLSASSLDSSASQESITVSDEELNYSCVHSTPAKQQKAPSKILHPRVQQLSSRKVVFEQQDLIETPTLENEANVTPGDNLVVKTKDVTPMPAYEAMDTPQVVRELSKYGVKKLKRRRGVELLKYIYESTHPSLEACENNKEDVFDEGRSSKRRRKLDLSEEKMVEDERVDVIGDDLMIAENDVILEKRKSKKIFSCQVPLHIAWHNLLATDRRLHENVLLYKPLQVEVLHGILKDQGLNYHIQDLISFLDKKCITIRTYQNQGARRKRH